MKTPDLPIALPSTEWRFTLPPTMSAGEQAACFYYELAREVPALTRGIATWRKKHQRLAAKLHVYLGRGNRWLSQAELQRLIRTGPEGWHSTWDWAVPWAFIGSFTQFPQQSWQTNNETETKTYWQNQLETFDPLRKAPDGIHSTIFFSSAILPRFTGLPEMFAHYALENAKNPTSPDFFLAMNWRWTDYSNNELVTIFREYIAEERPKNQFKNRLPERASLWGQMPFTWETGIRAISFLRCVEDLRRQLSRGKSASDHAAVKEFMRTYEGRDPWIDENFSLENASRDLRFARALIDWASTRHIGGVPSAPKPDRGRRKK